MSLKTRFANLANILDEKGQSDHVLAIDSPVLVGEDWDRLRAYFVDAVADIDCTFPVGGDASTLRDAIARVRREAEDAVRAGRSVLRSEEHTSELQSLIRISYAVFCLNKKLSSSMATAHPALLIVNVQ